MGEGYRARHVCKRVCVWGGGGGARVSIECVAVCVTWHCTGRVKCVCQVCVCVSGVGVCVKDIFALSSV